MKYIEDDLVTQVSAPSPLPPPPLIPRKRKSQPKWAAVKKQLQQLLIYLQIFRRYNTTISNSNKVIKCCLRGFYKKENIMYIY